MVSEGLCHRNAIAARIFAADLAHTLYDLDFKAKSSPMAQLAERHGHASPVLWSTEKMLSTSAEALRAAVERQASSEGISCSDVVRRATIRDLRLNAPKEAAR